MSDLGFSYVRYVRELNDERSANFVKNIVNIIKILN